MSFWAACLSEAAVILASQYPSSATARWILYNLMPTGTLSLDRIAMTPTFLVGWACTVVGGLGRLWCYRTMGRQFTFELSIRDDHQLVTSGPYAFVRHPSYTATFFALAGTFVHFGRGSWMTEYGVTSTWFGRICAGIWGSNASFLACLLLYRTRTEDEMLRAQFGRTWEDWASRVPYRLLPYVY
ncbi:hypothetical protein GLOTRDRAFT_43578 [Gloeophyllum trabeum ATCC 11539]|uniref:Protein-S-isoprenylcysteine O-methyltransferase n=1 Tax=Gloeophyllum trabeum (strain ATCC 11539 / FP-39264 / Madison 617) TaxID=670483 RepID=S7RJ77_GLOTA|nr:uncharacterized protein GLOTRDRAFT_43578 [Gloeophyllum trabeum ATCC 11539]EPQ54400.1 hypothetical protein GLOTRDRAFT_43578 [Gloeophyllum trabeum ATCC 11539]